MSRVLVVTRNYPPLLGGMERLNRHMVDELARRHEVRLIAPEGAGKHTTNDVRVREVPLNPLRRFVWRSACVALAEARIWRPDVVLAGSGLTAPAAWLAARACGARAVAYVHGLDVVVPNQVYQRVWVPMLRRMDRLVANSRATAALCEAAGVAPARVGVVHPGVAMPATLPAETSVAAFRHKHGLGCKPMLLSVGRLSARKGLLEFVTHALPAIARAVPHVVLVVVGDAPKHALHAQAQSPQAIAEAAESAGVGAHVHFLGILDDAELALAYGAANLHVFPIREMAGDPEGFGMVAIEAAAHGLRTVAFAAGGVSDAVCPDRSGWLVPVGNYAGLADAVVHALACGEPTIAQCQAFASQFEWQNFGLGITQELQRTITSLSETAL
ncbi:glycosyltransferase family 4 protein [Macromonas nakdongensis]|uniref:glycosyltransferase family 4 protein n=1 Tax=Macromonas nakdongensis TaxID=1843082 RepID=UPI000C31F694|nr:glycosyltransferase family 4 protein [Macromonas nakdongensis]